MSTTTPNAAELADTYDCPNEGVPKQERRKHARPLRSQAAEELFNGFSNVIGNLRREHYLQGYVTAMRDSFAKFQRTQAARIAELEAELLREHADHAQTVEDAAAVVTENRRLLAALAQQVPAVPARELARQVFALCEATEDMPTSPADDYGLERFRAGQRFEAKRIRRTIGDWLTHEESTRAAPLPTPGAKP